MPSNSKPSPDGKESGVGTSPQSIEDKIQLLSSELKKVRKANASFRGGIKATLLDVIDSINENEENERQELSKVVLSTDEGGVVETMSDGAPDGEVEVIQDDSSDGVAEVGTNCKGKSKHLTKKKKKSKKKKASKSKKNRGTNSSSSGSSEAVTYSSTNSYCWWANGGVPPKVMNKVVVVLMSIACLLSITYGHGNMEEKHDDPSSKKKQQRQHKTREGLTANAQNGEDGEGPTAAARILQASGLLTYSPITKSPTPTFHSPTMDTTYSPTVDLIYEGCDDTKDWVDEYGFGCRVYETYDEPGCPYYGFNSGDMGSAKDNCCHCNILAPSISPSTSLNPSAARIWQGSGLPTHSQITPTPTSPSPTMWTYLPTVDLIYEGCEDTKDWVDVEGYGCRVYETFDEPGCPEASNNFGYMGPAKDNCCHCKAPTPTLEQKCPVADKTTCGCDAVFKSDYRGAKSVTADGVACIRWDESEMGDIAVFPNAGLEGNNFCRNPQRDPNGPWCDTGGGDWGGCNIEACDPHKCMPPCGQPLNATRPCQNVWQSQECCGENESDCKCKYLKHACRISLQNDSRKFCGEAETECCKSRGGSSNSDCGCLLFEDICTDFPGETTCDAAGDKCCDDSDFGVCLCNFFEYTSSALNYESYTKEQACTTASYEKETPIQYLSAEIKGALEVLYNEILGGEYWTTNTNWLSRTIDHCDWYGIKCDDGYVTEINLNDNNVTGNVNDGRLWESLSKFSELAKLDLSNNNLRGRLDSPSISFYGVSRLWNLRHLDISGNNLSGHAPMSFSATTLYVNLSHNKITSISFRRSIPSKSLEVLDLRNNSITQDVSSVLRNIPPNIVQLDLSHNSIHGALAKSLPNLHRLQEFSIANNMISGTVPDFSRATPLIKMLDLSNQQLGLNGGLTGTIQPALSKLEDLTELYLAGNKLYGSIPTQFGNFLQLKVLDLSSNTLTKSIPVELENLDGSLDVLDVSHNKLTGGIPSVFGGFSSHFYVHSNGNSYLSSPAPWSLCSTGRTDQWLCPIERTILQAIYLSAKGSEWTKSDKWFDEYTSYCEWHGVTCDETNRNVTELKLKSNGLSGTLSTLIGELSSLAALDLRDNDIKGSVPEEIGLLSKLTKLQLSYNTFRGALPSNFSDLTSLQIIHLHANRFSGVIPELDLSFEGESSFIADCGYPSLYKKTLDCIDCTMCCNSQDECTPKGKAKLLGLTYMELAGVFLACIFGFSVALALVVVAFDNKFVTRVKEWVANGEGELGNNPTLSPSSQERPTLRSSLAHALQRGSSMDLYAKNAVARIGEDSTYCFLLGNSWCGWAIAVATIAIQLWLLFLFVETSEITDWTQDAYDFVYSWKCSWDNDKCDDKSDLDWEGMLAFGIITGAHVLKDIINGIRMIVSSALSTTSNTFTMSEMRTRIRYFIGGWLLVTVTSFTWFASAVYNKATATSNTEIIINSVVIIFMLEIDEYLHSSLKAISESWIKSMSANTEGDGQSGVPSGSKVDVKEDEGEGQISAPDHNIVVQRSTFSE